MHGGLILIQNFQYHGPDLLKTLHPITWCYDQNLHEKFYEMLPFVFSGKLEFLNIQEQQQVIGL